MDVYWDDIKEILSPGVGCMARISVGTPEGVFPVVLDDYETVKRLHQVIAAALNAWKRDPTGTQWELGPNGRAIRTKDHPMPPGGPLPIEDVDAFLQWVTDGMPESPAIA
jgi:hypothetical protein